jgi:hypothetical protein
MTDENVHPSGIYKISDLKIAYISELEKQNEEQAQALEQAKGAQKSLEQLAQENARLKAAYQEARTQTFDLHDRLDAAREAQPKRAGCGFPFVSTLIGSGIIYGGIESEDPLCMILGASAIGITLIWKGINYVFRDDDNTSLYDG